MTAEDWTHAEAEATREETADAAGMSPKEMASRRALPLPNRDRAGWPGAWEVVVNESGEVADD
ncbi:hypothetical protein [Halopiger xanaduensis]|nr:hypothetical protein [Halopiger xanaduensis]